MMTEPMEEQQRYCDPCRRIVPALRFGMLWRCPECGGICLPYLPDSTYRTILRRRYPGLIALLILGVFAAIRHEWWLAGLMGLGAALLGAAMISFVRTWKRETRHLRLL